MDFGAVLKSAADAAGSFFAGRTAAEQNQSAAQMALIQQGQQARQFELGAQTQQAAYRYLAVGAVALVVVLVLMKNKAI